MFVEEPTKIARIETVPEKPKVVQTDYKTVVSVENTLNTQNQQKKTKSGKRIRWADDQLETIKFFKLTDLPVTPGLSKDQVEEV